MGIYIKGWDIYPANIRRCGAVFEARFVDVPNCIAVGPSAAEAEKRAQSALGAYAAAVRRQGWPMPAPSVVKYDCNVRDNYVAYIRLLPAAGAANPALA